MPVIPATILFQNKVKTKPLHFISGICGIEGVDYPNRGSRNREDTLQDTVWHTIGKEKYRGRVRVDSIPSNTS
jgi:hypothetical protein